MNLKNIGYVVIMLFALQLPSNLYAADPVGFRDIPFGASVNQVKAGMPGLTCHASDNRVRMDYYCVGKIYIAELQVGIVFKFFNHHFSAFSLKFKPEQFDLIEDEFIGRYGQPTGRTSSEFQTQGGLNYTNEELTWQFENGANAKLSKYGRRSDRGHGSVRSKEYVDERNRRDEEAIDKTEEGL